MMRRLILLRHAKAERDSESGEDFDRALSPRGTDDAGRVGRALAERGWAPDLALVSPAARTRGTWAAAAQAFPGATAEEDRALYHAPAGVLRRAVEAAEDRAETVMLVGHNPGLHALAVALLIESGASHGEIDRLRARFPTATAALFTVDAAGRCAFEDLILVKALGGGGGE